MLSNLLDYIPDGVFTVDADWRVTFFNRTAEQITGIERAEALGRPCCEVFRASICETSCALKQTLATHRPVSNKVVYIVNAQGERIPIGISTAALKDARGKVIGGVESFRDLRLVNELRQAAEQQDSFSDIIGLSGAMRQLFDLLPAVAESDSTVLIEGASDTGKELFARAIHRHSRRRAQKCVTLNCGALPDTLLDPQSGSSYGELPIRAHLATATREERRPRVAERESSRPRIARDPAISMGRAGLCSQPLGARDGSRSGGSAQMPRRRPTWRFALPGHAHRGTLQRIGGVLSVPPLQFLLLSGLLSLFAVID